jgi:hypothetical protein
MGTDEGKKVVATFESQLSFRETLDLRESDLRQAIASNVVSTFLWINGAVFLFVIIVFIADSVLIVTGLLPSSDRIIDGRVIISINVATTIQLGAVAFSLSQWLFPRIEKRSYPRSLPQDGDNQNPL